MRIDTAEQYRTAVEETQRIGAPAEGTPEYARLQELRGALHEFEERHKHPDWRPGRGKPLGRPS